MNVHLYERAVANALEAVHFAGFDHEDVAGARLEFLAVHVIEPAAFADALASISTVKILRFAQDDTLRSA